MKIKFCNRLLFIVLSAVCCVVSPCCSQNMCGSFSRSLQLDTLVTRGQLKNGLTYYIRKNNYPRGQVAFLFTVKAGYVQQDVDQAGLAHLVEHMAMKATTNISNVWTFLDSLGVRLGTEGNATAGSNETYYWFLVSSDSIKIKRSLLLLSEIAHNVKFDKEGIESEKGVVINEISQSESYEQRVYGRFFPLLIRNSEYAKRYKNAAEEINNLSSFSSESLIRFYSKWYCGEWESVAVVGDIDVKEVKHWVDKYFGGISDCAVTEPINNNATLSGDNLFRIIKDSEIPNTEIRIFMKHLRYSLNTEENYRIGLMKDLLDDVLRHRINRINNIEERSFYKVKHSILDDDLLNLEALNFNVTCKPGKIEASFKTIVTEIERLNQYAISEDELVRSRNTLIRRMETSLDTSSIAWASRYKSHFLGMGESGDVVNEFKLRACILNQITPGDLDSLAKAWVADINRDIFILTPDSLENSLPGEQVFLKWWQEIKGSRIRAIDFRSVATQFVKAGEFARMNKLKFSREHIEHGIIKYNLSNDVTLLFKPTRPSRSIDSEIRMNAFRVGGTDDLSAVNAFLAEAAVDIISNSGLGQMNSNELNSFLRDKNVTITPYIYSNMSGFGGVSSSESFEIMLQAFYKYFTQPNKNQSAFKNWQERLQLTRSQKTPNAQQIFRDSVDAITGFQKRCDYCKVFNPKFEQIYGLYRSMFDDVRGFTFVFSGEFDVDTIFPIVLRYIQMLPTRNKRYIRSTLYNDQEYKKQNTCRTFFVENEGDRAYVELQVDLDKKYTQSPENDSNLDLFASLLQDRLTDRLRVREGGTYIVIAQVNYMERPFKRYQLRINFDCLPKDLQRMQNAVIEELQSVNNSDESEFNRVAAKQIYAVEERITNDAFWVFYLSKQTASGKHLSEVFDQLLFLKQLKFRDFKRFILDYTVNVSINNFTLLPKKYEGEIKSICVTEF